MIHYCQKKIKTKIYVKVIFHLGLKRTKERAGSKWGQGGTVTSVSITASAFSLGAGKSGWQLSITESATQTFWQFLC